MISLSPEAAELINQVPPEQQNDRINELIILGRRAIQQETERIVRDLWETWNRKPEERIYLAQLYGRYAEEEHTLQSLGKPYTIFLEDLMQQYELEKKRAYSTDVSPWAPTIEQKMRIPAIASKMRSAGLDHKLINAAASLAGEYGGIYDLMQLWDEEETAEERELIIADLKSELILIVDA
jgi:hypothetical protein